MRGPTEGDPPAAVSFQGLCVLPPSLLLAVPMLRSFSTSVIIFFLPNPVCLCATVGVCFKYFDLIHFAFRKKLELYL